MKSNHVGKRFGMLFVQEEAGRSPQRHVLYRCLCDCGNTTVVLGHNLSNGGTQSCGCNKGNIKHHLKHTPEYNIWLCMKQRCYNPHNPNYEDYGGRGITVCGRWINDAAAFIQDMGPRPGKGWSVNRKDNDGNYEPLNCEWATQLEQVHNRRPMKTKIPFTVVESIRSLRSSKGYSYCMIAKQCGVSPTTVRRIVNNTYRIAA